MLTTRPNSSQDRESHRGDSTLDSLDAEAIARESRRVARQCRAAVLVARLPRTTACRGLDRFIARIDELCRQRLAIPREAQPEPELEVAL